MPVEAAEVLAREAIEGLVGRLAAEQPTDEQLTELEAVQTEMTAVLDRGAYDELVQLNADFHRRLADASGYQVLGDLTELLPTIRRYRIVAPIDEPSWHSVVRERDEILENPNPDPP
ncbi:FCD domain-containing protein [Kribbella sp. NPDC048928]|uniref:FCD domain-containing protein n=1 Tax=Kribbella sp. NPDC048928 TaxID=3364111 RepID=UPI00371E38FB